MQRQCRASQICTSGRLVSCAFMQLLLCYLNVKVMVVGILDIMFTGSETGCLGYSNAMTVYYCKYTDFRGRFIFTRAFSRSVKKSRNFISANIFRFCILLSNKLYTHEFKYPRIRHKLGKREHMYPRITVYLQYSVL